MALRNQMGVPYRGVVRRRAILEAGIRVERHDAVSGADVLWCLAIALQAGLVYDDRTVTHKRFHGDGATARLGGDALGAHERAVLDLLRRDGPSGATGWAMRSLTRAAWLQARLRPVYVPVYRRLRPRRAGPPFDLD
jgi:hypothetical protein